MENPSFNKKTNKVNQILINTQVDTRLPDSVGDFITLIRLIVFYLVKAKTWSTLFRGVLSHFQRGYRGVQRNYHPVRA